MSQPEGIRPLHYLPFDGSQEVHDVAFLDEGGRAIVHFHVDAIDLWAVAVFVWPEVLGTLAGLWLLVWLRIAWRRAHRPRRRGVLFCRRCNYELGPQDERERLVAVGGRCPECGRLITARLLVRGRAQRWRIAGPVAVGLLPGAALGVLVASVGFARLVPAMTWFDLPSQRFSAWTADRGWTWFDRFRWPIDRLEMWDLAAGRRTGVVRVGGGPTNARLCLTGDGSGIIVAGRGRSLDCLDVATGKRRARLALPAFGRLVSNEHHIVAHPTKPAVVFALLQVDDAREFVLYEWDTVSGASAVVRRLRTHETQSDPWLDFRLARATMDGEPVLVALATDFSVHYQGLSEVAVLSLSGEIVSTFEFDPAWKPDGSIALPGVPRVFVAGSKTHVAGAELPSGDRIERFGVPGHFWSVFSLASDESGRLLFVASYDDTIAVRDTQTGEWLPSLIEDTPTYFPQLSISPGGRWVAAVGPRDQGVALTSASAQDVLVWKLPDAWFDEP